MESGQQLSSMRKKHKVRLLLLALAHLLIQRVGYFVSCAAKVIIQWHEKGEICMYMGMMQ